MVLCAVRCFVGWLLVIEACSFRLNSSLSLSSPFHLIVVNLPPNQIEWLLRTEFFLWPL